MAFRNEPVATQFVLHAICEWGDPPEVRIKAVQDVLDAAAFSATATCWPVFGGLWPKRPTGKDSNAAAAWLQILTDTMQRGHFEDEVAHVARMITDRQKAFGG